MLLVAMLAVMPMVAQNDDGERIGVKKEKGNALFLGPKIGVTMTTMTQPDEGTLYDGAGIGVAGGLAAKVRFGRATAGSPAGTGYIGLAVEAKYRLNSVKTHGTDEDGKADAKLNLGYLDVPVSVQIYPVPKVVNSLYVELGCSFATLLSRSPKTLTVANPSEDYSSVTYNIDSDASKLKGGAINPFVGLGYTIPGTGLDVNVRYIMGANKLAENFNSKLTTFELSLAWNFQVCEF